MLEKFAINREKNIVSGEIVGEFKYVCKGSETLQILHLSPEFIPI
jgi:hypothetical protein